MKNLLVILVLIAATSAFSAETKTDNAGYTTSNESAERVAADAAWDKLQEEFDKPNP